MFQRLNLIYGSIFLLSSLTLYLVPDLDIKVSHLFYDENIGFIYAHNIIVRGIFKLVHPLTIGFGIYLLIGSVYFYTYRNQELQSGTEDKALHTKNSYIQKSLLYLTLLLSLIMSSGVVVNLILKENFGRARPAQISEFNGGKKFTNVFTLASQCDTNCSFSSGHAAAAFTFASSSALFVNPYSQIIVYTIGILFGLIVSLGRILQGGHFLSDTLSSGAIVIIINYLFMLAYLAYSKNVNQ